MKLNGYSQVLGKYELSFNIQPTVFANDKTHIQYMKNEYKSKVKLLQVETVFSRLFSLKKNISIQAGLGLHYQYYSFSNIINGTKLSYGPDPGQFYEHVFEDKPTLIEHGLSLNFNIGLNYLMKPIFKHNNYLSCHFNINLTKLQYSNYKTDDKDITISLTDIYNNWQLNLINSNAMDAGINYHFNLNKTEKEKKTYLILGLNYEIYNSPDLYDFRLFSTIGFAYQFGELKSKKKD